MALQSDDVNLTGRFLEVRRNFTHGHQSGESRRVDLSRQLTVTLEVLQLDRQIESAAQGQDAAPRWVFCDRLGKPFHQNWVRLRFFRLLKGAGVRQVRFHDLRHTFASLLLRNGECAVYVKDQMGNCSIQVTVDLYGHLIRGGNKQAVDRLDVGVEERRLMPESATPAQPAAAFGPLSSDSVGISNS